VSIELCSEPGSPIGSENAGIHFTSSRVSGLRGSQSTALDFTRHFGWAVQVHFASSATFVPFREGAYFKDQFKFKTFRRDSRPPSNIGFGCIVCGIAPPSSVLIEFHLGFHRWVRRRHPSWSSSPLLQSNPLLQPSTPAKAVPDHLPASLLRFVRKVFAERVALPSFLLFLLFYCFIGLEIACKVTRATKRATDHLDPLELSAPKGKDLFLPPARKLSLLAPTNQPTSQALEIVDSPKDAGRTKEEREATSGCRI